MTPRNARAEASCARIRGRARGAKHPVFGTLPLVALIILGAAAALPAAPMRPGTGWYSSGTDAAALAGGSALASVFAPLRNPAALAQSKVLQLGLQYSQASTADFENPAYQGPDPKDPGIGGTVLGAGFGASIPLGFGVININAALDYDMGDAALYSGSSSHSGVLGKIGFAKALTPHFHLGASAGAIAYDVGSTRFSPLGDIGFILLQNGTLAERKAAGTESGFGIFDCAFSLAFNIGGYERLGMDYSRIHAITGLEFFFIKSEPFKLGMNLNALLAVDRFSLRYSGGLEMVFFDTLHLRGAVHRGYKEHGEFAAGGKFPPLALGAGLDLSKITKGFNLSLSWAMVSMPISIDKSLYETAHFITLNHAFGSGDPAPDIESRLRAFSPNGDGDRDTTVFDISLAATDDVAAWEIRIKNADGRIARSVQGKAEGKKRIVVPKTWEWNGRDSMGRLLPDGTYMYQLIARDTAGGEYASESKPVDIRSAPVKTEVSLEAEPGEVKTSPGTAAGFFAPDDIRNENLFITLNTQDPSLIESWKVQVKRGDTVFKTFTGKGPIQVNETIAWDGRSNSGRLVQSGSSYTVEGSTVDYFGNVGHSAPLRVDIDLLMLNDKRGIKMVISDIEVDSADVFPRGSPNFRLADMVREYPDRRVVIEGHTDNTGDTAYNRDLSERRARAVARYLVLSGIDGRRLTVRGRGQASPVASNATEDGRSQNRRVEIFLVKE